MVFPITSFAGSILAIWLVILTVRVIQGRRSTSISMGDGDDAMLKRRIRAHANFAEFVPIGLILIFVSEANGFSHFWLGVLALTFVAARILHGYGMAFTQKCVFCRVGGTAMTLAVLLVMALWNLVLIAGAFFSP